MLKEDRDVIASPTAFLRSVVAAIYQSVHLVECIGVGADPVPLARGNLIVVVEPVLSENSTAAITLSFGDRS